MQTEYLVWVCAKAEIKPPCLGYYMRRLWIALVLILVSVSAATGVRLHALTECERWITEYREALAQSPSVQRANAVRHRISHYVRHKVTSKKTSGARILPARFMRPKMGREEALRKMEFACGSIDPDEPALNDIAIAASPAPTFVPAAFEEGSGPLAAPLNLVAQNTLPPAVGGGFPIGAVPAAPTFPGVGGGVPPGGGGGGVPPGGGGGLPPDGGGTDNPPPPPPPPPPTAETPEPGSLILMATGLVSAAVVLRRRVSARS